MAFRPSLGFGNSNNFNLNNNLNNSKSVQKKGISQNQIKNSFDVMKNESEERFKNEITYFINFIKKEKSAKIIMGLFIFFILTAIVYFSFFSDAPRILNTIVIFFVIISSIIAFFFELLLLSKGQFLIGVFIVDFSFFIYKKILQIFNKKPKKMPWLLVKFNGLLRINAPFFKRVTKQEYEKMSSIEKENYIKKYNEYLKAYEKAKE